MRSPAPLEPKGYIFLSLSFYCWCTTGKLLYAIRCLTSFSCSWVLTFLTLPSTISNGYPPSGSTLFPACLPFPFYAFATPSSFAVPVLPKEPSLAPGYGKPPLVWMSLHKTSKPLSNEAPAPCFQMYPISVKQSSSFEEGPQETVLIHVVMHDHILINTRTLRSRDFCFKLMCNHLDS